MTVLLVYFDSSLFAATLNGFTCGSMASPMVETPLTRKTAITLAIYVYYLLDSVHSLWAFRLTGVVAGYQVPIPTVELLNHLISWVEEVSNKRVQRKISFTLLLQRYDIITISGSGIIYHGIQSPQKMASSIRHTQAHVFRRPPTGTVIWPVST